MCLTPCSRASRDQEGEAVLTAPWGFLCALKSGNCSPPPFMRSAYAFASCSSRPFRASLLPWEQDMDPSVDSLMASGHSCKASLRLTPSPSHKIRGFGEFHSHSWNKFHCRESVLDGLKSYLISWNSSFSFPSVSEEVRNTKRLLLDPRKTLERQPDLFLGLQEAHM